MNNFWSFLLMTVLLTASGCVSVDYIGQTLPPEPDAEIVFYPSMKDVPLSMKPIGRGSIVAPSEYNQGDIEEILDKKAREIGAEGVAIDSYKRVLTGVMNNVETLPERPNGSWTVLSTTPDGNQMYTNTFGQGQGLKTVQTKRYRIEVKAVFLADQKRVLELLKFDSSKRVDKTVKPESTPAINEKKANE